MEITLKNSEIALLYTAIERLEIRQMTANRGRAKLLSRLRDKYKEYHEYEQTLLSDYVEVDDEGNYCKADDGNYMLKEPGKLSELNSQLSEWATEKIVIQSGEYGRFYTAFLDFLSEVDEVFSTDEIILLDRILEEYETTTEKGE